MKYIRTENSGFIIFSKVNNHIEIYNKFKHGNLISAGFIDKELNCYGESISLGIKSKEEDTEILKERFYNF